MTFQINEKVFLKVKLDPSKMLLFMKQKISVHINMSKRYGRDTRDKIIFVNIMNFVYRL